MTVKEKIESYQSSIDFIEDKIINDNQGLTSNYIEILKERKRNYENFIKYLKKL